jgi:cytochrome P450
MYSCFNDGRPNLFDGIDREAHKERRKLLAHAFARTSTLDAEPLVVEQIQRFQEWLKRFDGKPMNVHAWFRMLSLDIISSLFMGEAVGALNSEEEPAYLQDLDNHTMICGMRWQLPYLFPLTSWIPAKSWQYFLHSQDRLYDHGRHAFEKYIAKYGRLSQRNDLLKRVLVGDKTVQPLTDDEICAEIGSLMIGGTDTTSVTLTYICWELAKRPDIQKQLRAELVRARKHPDTDVLVYADVEHLPFFDAVVTEGLRLHPAATGSLPRIVPKGGQMIAGKFISEGVSTIEFDILGPRLICLCADNGLNEHALHAHPPCRIPRSTYIHSVPLARHKRWHRGYEGSIRTSTITFPNSLR